MNAATVIAERRGEAWFPTPALRREWGRRTPALQGGAPLAGADGRPSRWFAGVWRTFGGPPLPRAIVTDEGRPTLEFLQVWR